MQDCFREVPGVVAWNVRSLAITEVVGSKEPVVRRVAGPREIRKYLAVGPGGFYFLLGGNFLKALETICSTCLGMSFMPL